MPVEEKNLKVFIDSTIRCFHKLTGESADIEPPYIKGKDAAISHYTGIIGISGKQKGAVYFSATLELLMEFLTAMGEPNPNPELSLDTVGEIANVIAGNARREFGSEFMISVPVVVQGKEVSIALPTRVATFVIPIRWRKKTSLLVVGLE
jgi:chemotaxis protein CheX